MTKEKMKIYRRRQIILLICVDVIIIAIVTAIVLIFISKDKEPIKNGVNPTASQTDESGIPVDGGKENQQGSIRFEESEITIKVGETYNAKVINESGNSDDYIWESSNLSVASVDNGEIKGQSEGSCNITVTINGTNQSASLRVNVETEDITENNSHDITVENGITYIDGIMIANKSYSMPADFDPGVNQEALDAFNEMAADVADEGLSIYISSDYRSYYDQERIYNNYVERDGQEAADTYSSRPGHSDHQTGLAFDLNSIDDSFGYTPESDWVAANAHKYGFIIRFPEGKEDITGYQYEPWHIRYLGVEKATEVFESGLCLEEFLNIDSVYKD